MEMSMGENVESREARKRKLGLQESEFSLSSSSFHQLKTPRVVTASENSAACGDVNADRVFSSRCLSNASKISEPEDENEASSASSTGDSMDFSDRSIKTRKAKEPVKIPSEAAELEEFFEAAEKDLLKNFILKYNYDIVKDQPLEGSYEWIQNSTEDMNKKR